MSEIVELARPQAEAAKIRVVAQFEADDVEVRVDRDLLKQAVLNVVVNAMQAMPEGGELRFEPRPPDDTAEIRISDTGAGIPPELREKIFRLYFTTKEGAPASAWRWHSGSCNCTMVQSISPANPGKARHL